MRRHQSPYTNDGESLQTDVMRFMAIIAFCLIAVLALVRNVEPPTRQSVPLAPVADAPGPEPAELPAAGLTAGTPRVEQQIEQRFAQEIERPPAASASAQPPPVAIAEDSRADPVVAEATSREQGLSLRFASDRDFLRLVNKGEIKVFAYQRDTVLGLDRNFEFLSVEPPGRIYELLPETIPRLIFAALDRVTAESHSFTWGIRMPRELEGKIRGFIDRRVHGELVIDRYGEVHHVAS